MSAESLIFNGINGATGSYLFPAMTPEDISKIKTLMSPKRIRF